MNQEHVSKMLTDFENALDLQDCRDMQPWEIIIAKRDSLPSHEQKIVELFVKLGEAQQILNELKYA